MLFLMQTITSAQGPGATATPAPAIARTVEQDMDVGALRGQINELQIQLTGLQAQWQGLYSQLNVMLKNNPARPGVQQEWADVGVRIAQIKGEIAYHEARIALKQGVPGGTTTTPPPFPSGRSLDPNVAFPAAAVLFMVLGLPVSIAWARRLLRGKPQPAPLPPDYASRLENIEQAIDTVAIEVERISEGQRFVTKILVDRSGRDVAAPSNADAPSASPAPKALGAGPIEPISVPQRERVHQRINTPR
jgi:hypothetical protein